MRMFRESKSEEKKSPSSQTAGLFATVPSLKDIMIDRLIEQLGGIAELNKQVVRDPRLWGAINERLTQHFLLLVVQGKQGQVEAMLKVNPALILFARGDVTDYSGQTFKNISAWEYVLWAYDSHMYRMLFNYIPKEQRPLALQQLIDLETNGIAYTLSEKVMNAEREAEETRETIIREAHYDFSPLIDALQTYVTNVERWSFEECVEHWRKKVGGAQCMVPVHVGNEYCYPDRSFDPIPRFNEKNLPRRHNFYNYVSGADESWFPLSPAGLGTNFAIMRGCMRAVAGACWRVGRQWACNDLAAITALREVRQSDLIQLKEQLQNPAPESAPSTSKTLRSKNP
ncbi:Dot/Icm T4SS effector CpeA [Coxiella burnetii]|uniref:Uncharacterized protein CBUA0006 n=2 Tax=Coxiella burnetii TaxID=777 RepID=Y3006_COXBU|nr:Dot/Icm T4SS effector CpeA [Coxiella burnetii]NP_819024.1 hypothetical protein CBUA0006 [Coxiella burnetii RSA 493]Q45952.1 RecName: Full=Uncharacterized protein CBUA0006 [Coxiella burnetii RSA 493]AAO91584.1 hypothetical protein CBUA0006 [Coxiella burnetii RSA 493]ABX77183.1 conserved hypothetical protein [Coxiella burnetii RSA 331]ARI66894.1 hypothetical protein B7L74_10880 [Coxiella burnetii]ARK28358.1 hypothetical protein BMW92_10510 [Coxiella burnetii]ATN83085.1 hypothetical protein 